jgi:hypothetical protein
VCTVQLVCLVLYGVFLPPPSDRFRLITVLEPSIAISLKDFFCYSNLSGVISRGEMSGPVSGAGWGFSLRARLAFGCFVYYSESKMADLQRRYGNCVCEGNVVMG